MLKLKMLVEVELNKRDIIDASTIEEDLVGELVKVKTGPYENMFYGEILEVQRLNSGKVQRA